MPFVVHLLTTDETAKQSIILGIGTGRCGTASLAKILNQQPDVRASYEERPLLPWSGINAVRVLRGRFARFRQNGKAKILGDVASFYLPFPHFPFQCLLVSCDLLAGKVAERE